MARISGKYTKLCHSEGSLLDHEYLFVILCVTRIFGQSQISLCHLSSFLVRHTNFRPISLERQETANVVPLPDQKFLLLSLIYLHFIKNCSFYSSSVSLFLFSSAPKRSSKLSPAAHSSSIIFSSIPFLLPFGEIFINLPICRKKLVSWEA